MDKLHLALPGISRMKALVYSYVWWPNNKRRQVKSWTPCQLHRKSPPRTLLHPWDWPACPWSRFDVDYADPSWGKYTQNDLKEKQYIQSATSRRTIQLLRSMFATHGLPKLLVTDNGSVFINLKNLYVRMVSDVMSTSYHPASNRLAKRPAQTLKQGLQKSSIGTVEANMEQFLLQYQIPPYSITGISPAELLLGRKPRCHSGLLHQILPQRFTAAREDRSLLMTGTLSREKCL